MLVLFRFFFCSFMALMNIVVYLWSGIRVFRWSECTGCINARVLSAVSIKSDCLLASPVDKWDNWTLSPLGHHCQVVTTTTNNNYTTHYITTTQHTTYREIKIDSSVKIWKEKEIQRGQNLKLKKTKKNLKVKTVKKK